MSFLQALVSLWAVILFGVVIIAGCLWADSCSDRAWRNALDRAERTRREVRR